MRYQGNLCWKSAVEYNPDGGIFGTPYFIITQEKDKCYFYQYDTEVQQ